MALESIAISIALGTVKLLLNEVLVEVGKPLWEGDKYAKTLRHLLQCIDPVLSTMDAPRATPEQLKWLQEVEPCLKDIQMVLHTHEERKFTSKLGTSRELMKKMQWLRELCQTEVPVMTMHNSNVTMHNSNEILQQLSSMEELLKDMKEQMEGLELERDKGFQDSKQVAGMATSSRHQDTYTTFGREHDIVVEVAIQELLVDSKATSMDDVECVGIWGLGGSGKTLVATRVFNKEEIQAHFTGGCYWVTVGSSKTSVPKLLGEIYKKMVSPHHAHVGDEDIKDEDFRGLKGRERMLLVLDDVWKIQTLEILEVMPKGVQCKVLITTRNEGILNRKHATKWKMPNLSREESWKLFCHHACCGDAGMPLDLERIGRQIANECGGLPLALKVIGGYLAGSIDPSYWAIQELLVDSKATSMDDVECVGIWGLGGSGKTLVATRVFNKEEIQAHFTGGCYWVTVGSSKTSVPKLLGEIYKKMVSPHHAHVGDEDIKDEDFRGLKGRERMLLVLDDVWKIQTLEILEVMPKGVQCKVLITTRNEGILNRKHATKWKMPNLSREESWKLFCHHACCGDAGMPLDLERIGRQIANECGGLPLALKVIGGYLAGSIDPSYWERTIDPSYWERTLDRLRNASLVSSDQYEQLYSKLESSVDELEKVHPRLKDCFFYFAAFPEDYEVEVERDLFLLWVGDQIVGKKDPMGDAKELLDILVQRSLIEVCGVVNIRLRRSLRSVIEMGGGEFYTGVHYVIHDVLRDLIRHMLQKLTLERRDCLYEAGQDLACFPEEYQKMSSPILGVLSAQRLSIMGSKVKELPPKLLNAPKLQVMMLRGNSIEAIPAGFFSGNFGNLRVLDLSKTEIRSLPKSVKNLKQLVVLNLSWSNLEKLSSSFVKAVTNLQVLNVSYCELEYLPSSIASLSKLQYLYARWNNDLWKEGGWLRNPLRSKATLADIMKLVLLEEVGAKYQVSRGFARGHV